MTKETIFPNLTAAVNAHFDNEAADTAAKLDTLTNAEALNNWYYKDLMTPAAMDIIKNSDPAATIPETAKKKMFSRFTCGNEKDRRRYLSKLDAAAAAPVLDCCVIPVEWANNRTWGKNPTCTIAYYQTATGHATGCGYDKQSAAIAYAMNDHPAIMRILYEHAEKGEKFPYSVHDYAGIPFFDGGCGVSCFYSVFAACGYEFKDVSHSRNLDCYHLIKRRVKQ